LLEQRVLLIQEILQVAQLVPILAVAVEELVKVNI
jgi:hypothetical protein